MPFAVDLSRCVDGLLTWARALPGISVTTEALARSDDDRARCWQSLMMADEEEPARVTSLT